LSGSRSRINGTRKDDTLVTLIPAGMVIVLVGLFSVLKDFATLNAVQGAFGGIMALLLWIYLSRGSSYSARVCALPRPNAFTEHA